MIWSTAFINNLPDSSFAFIEDGGKKDSDGKTTPRSKRHLPYKDADGKVDAAHTRNALARLNQTDAIPSDERPKIQKMLQNALGKANGKSTNSTEELTELIKEKGWIAGTSLKLDAGAPLPTRFPLLHTGHWEKSTKGDFKVTIDDLRQVKQNFDAGIGFPTEDASTGLAIDLAHDYAHEAAAWIKGMELQTDPSDPEKATLFATNVEWTDIGEQAIRSGQYKCISPMGFFGSKSGKLSMWSNPTNLKERIANVLEGAGLTNIPFLRGMAPIRADKLDDNDSAYDKVVYVYDSQTKHKEPEMNIDELRVKERNELTVPELDHLEEHKSELSKEELTKFQLDAGDEGDDNGDKLSDEDRSTLAAIKSGDKKVVDAKEQSADQERLTKLEATVDKYEKKDAQAILDKHVKRGAIKSDQAKTDGFWGKQLLTAASDEERQSVEEALDALPDNPDLAEEHGSSSDTQAGSTAREQLDKIAKEKVDKAAKDGKQLLYSDALKEAYRENTDLRTQDSQDQKTKAGALNAAGV